MAHESGDSNISKEDERNTSVKQNILPPESKDKSEVKKLVKGRGGEKQPACLEKPEMKSKQKGIEGLKGEVTKTDSLKNENTKVEEKVKPDEEKTETPLESSSQKDVGTTVGTAVDTGNNSSKLGTKNDGPSLSDTKDNKSCEKENSLRNEFDAMSTNSSDSNSSNRSRRGVRKRSADEPVEELKEIPKKKKEDVFQPPKLTGNVDIFCWRCHKDGSVFPCKVCPRVFHLRCAKLEEKQDQWICYECETVIKAETFETRPEYLKKINIEQLSKLLRFAIQRMRTHEGSSHFNCPVDAIEYPQYKDFVIKPMDLGKLDNNIKNLAYGSTESFVADCKWLVHNSIIFNSVHSELTTIARALVKIAKKETEEIENCPDCYLHAYSLQEEKWFIEPCTTPHVLVWAKLKGFPFWPCKVMKTIGNEIDVRFFSDHNRAWVAADSCYLISQEFPASSKQLKFPNLESGIKEMREHVKKLEEKFGKFNYFPYRTSYDPRKHFPILKDMLPDICFDQIHERDVTTKAAVTPKSLTPLKKDLVKQVSKEEEKLWLSKKVRSKTYGEYLALRKASMVKSSNSTTSNNESKPDKSPSVQDTKMEVDKSKSQVRAHSKYSVQNQNKNSLVRRKQFVVSEIECSQSNGLENDGEKDSRVISFVRKPPRTPNDSIRINDVQNSKGTGIGKTNVKKNLKTENKNKKMGSQTIVTSKERFIKNHNTDSKIINSEKQIVKDNLSHPVTPNGQIGFHNKDQLTTISDIDQTIKCKCTEIENSIISNNEVILHKEQVPKSVVSKKIENPELVHINNISEKKAETTVDKEVMFQNKKIFRSKSLDNKVEFSSIIEPEKISVPSTGDKLSENGTKCNFQSINDPHISTSIKLNNCYFENNSKLMTLIDGKIILKKEPKVVLHKLNDESINKFNAVKKNKTEENDSDVGRKKLEMNKESISKIFGVDGVNEFYSTKKRCTIDILAKKKRIETTGKDCSKEENNSIDSSNIKSSVQKPEECKLNLSSPPETVKRSEINDKEMKGNNVVAECSSENVPESLDKEDPKKDSAKESSCEQKISGSSPELQDDTDHAKPPRTHSDNKDKSDDKTAESVIELSDSEDDDDCIAKLLNEILLKVEKNVNKPEKSSFKKISPHVRADSNRLKYSTGRLKMFENKVGKIRVKSAHSLLKNPGHMDLSRIQKERAFKKINNKGVSLIIANRGGLHQKIPVKMTGSMIRKKIRSQHRRNRLRAKQEFLRLAYEKVSAKETVEEVANRTKEQHRLIDETVESVLTSAKDGNDKEEVLKILTEKLGDLKIVWLREIEEYRSLTCVKAHEMESAVESSMQNFRADVKRYTERKVNETKRRCWCVVCLKEARFYCCWAATYCSATCQTVDWPKHIRDCTQQTMRANDPHVRLSPHFQKILKNHTHNSEQIIPNSTTIADLAKKVKGNSSSGSNDENLTCLTIEDSLSSSPAEPLASSPANPAASLSANPAAPSPANPAVSSPSSPATSSPANPAASSSANPAASSSANPEASSCANSLATDSAQTTVSPKCDTSSTGNSKMPKQTLILKQVATLPKGVFRVPMKPIKKMGCLSNLTQTAKLIKNPIFLSPKNKSRNQIIFSKSSPNSKTVKCSSVSVKLNNSVRCLPSPDLISVANKKTPPPSLVSGIQKKLNFEPLLLEGIGKNGIITIPSSSQNNISDHNRSMLKMRNINRIVSQMKSNIQNKIQLPQTKELGASRFIRIVNSENGVKTVSQSEKTPRPTNEKSLNDPLAIPERVFVPPRVIKKQLIIPITKRTIPIEEETPLIPLD